MNDDEHGSPSNPPNAVEVGADLSLDAVFELLSDRRRRYVLYALAGSTDEVVESSAVIEEVATLEVAIEGAALTQERYMDVAADLHHWHLPVLSDLGVIDRDERHGTIRYRRATSLETWVDAARRDELS